MPIKPPPLILASASPRRRDLLGRLGVRFRVRPAAVDETPRPGEPPADLAARLAAAKACWAAERSRGPAWVLGCDTVVALGRTVLGKPRDEAAAAEMLARLSGRWHRVISAISLVPAGGTGGRARHRLAETRVRFRRLSAGEISWLLAAGEHGDKAGGYALQGRAGAAVEDMRGTASNVVGLPLDLTARLLEGVGYLPVSRPSPRSSRTRQRS